MGGAAFPTSVKVNPALHQPVRTLVVNGAECEPYISCDDMLMRERSDLIARGASILMHLLHARECLIGIEDNKPEAVEAMRLAVARSDVAEAAHVCVIPTLYPSGGEKQLIRILTGKEVPTDGIPAQIGILCQNVATLAAVAEAVLEGKPLISRYVTLSGRGIREPRNLEVLIGTSIGDLIQSAGGRAGQTGKLVLGGPMMGFSLGSDQVPITKAANCVLALTMDEAPEPGPALPCIRCGKCAEVCPASLLPQQMYWYARSKDMEKVQEYNLFDCIECGCCAQVCPSRIPLVQYYRYAKTESWAREQEKRAAERARARHEARDARLARLDQERKAKLRKKKEALSGKPAAAKREAGAEGGAALSDPKKAAIEAARQRVAAKKAALAKQGVRPQNTQELTAAQQRQIDAAKQRRQDAGASGAGSGAARGNEASGKD
jgi:electron transport complex protein RnfC